MLTSLASIAPPLEATVLHTLGHDVLPAVAAAVGLMTATWLACAVVTICGTYLGNLARALIRTCTCRVRRRNATDAQLATAHSDDVTTTIVHLDHYRRHEQPSGSSDCSERPGDADPGPDEPA